ncbi:pyridoxal phosphate-dependent decarboxylase family protein [Pseudaestuariivita atlantica]|uniref:Amino acid decarboxylase n=1 Tax=Pseudaestuariivita atlantica TaxID=1317121 RepID=A0A0L1JSX6_9RHOB|nr:pyridoxal-dependent decarboxylase [Pseudaestuariivita atlantica]KNG94884.1 amino acid decarboxylase [Pseudaestuariivita atlantica]
MEWEGFSDWGRHVADWAEAYHRDIRDRPVRAQTAPGDIAAQIAPHPPEQGEGMEAIFRDFERIVMPGMTHWQHPRFFAYFTSNASPASVLAEYIVSTIAAQCMLWQTSPAATEMEGVMIDWLAQALGLPAGTSGVIQDSASSATLSAVLTMRERATGWRGNREGLNAQGRLRIYCSDEVHSSIDRACWVAGIGQDNLVKLPTTGAPHYGMDTHALRRAIDADLAAGHIPAGIIAITGGTGIGACDDLNAVADVAEAHDLYTHLDAAWAGSAMICPDLREPFWDGAGRYDSIVFNPHKWLGVQFDCAAQFLRDPRAQLNTLKIEPEYLKTSQTVINYSEWTIPLGRRFRALKLWFVMRAYGLEGLRARIRNHVIWAQELCEVVRAMDGFEIVTGPILSLLSFRCPGDDAMQQRLVDAINDDGRIYLTQGMHEGRRMIRLQVGQFETTREDVMMAADVIAEVWSTLK